VKPDRLRKRRLFCLEQVFSAATFCSAFEQQLVVGLCLEFCGILMPPKEFRPFTDSERVLQSKTVTLAWQKRALNTRVHQGVADLAAFLSDFRKLLHVFSVYCPSGTSFFFAALFSI
jgi:hypothetical protein